LNLVDAVDLQNIAATYISRDEKTNGEAIVDFFTELH
jgi:hypothetical protein